MSRRRMSYLLLPFCGKKSFLESPFREQNSTRKPSTTWDFKFTAIFRWVGHSGKKATVEPIPGALLARLKGSKTFIAHTHSLRKRKREREREYSFDRRQAQTKPIQVDQFKESFEKIFIFPEGLPSIWEVWETLLLHEMCVCVNWNRVD